jgi:diguanylate cyclase (GGDEF)-like protein
MVIIIVEKPLKSLLIVEADSSLATKLATLLEADFKVVLANSTEMAQRVLAIQPVDLLLTGQANSEWLLSRLLERNRELERDNRTDGLTGLFNRRAMEEMAALEINRLNRYGGSLALGYLDLDHFKQINVDYLLTGGDAVLKQLATLLARSIRAADSIGRMGGDEFLILARDTGRKGAEVLAERIRATVESSANDYEGKVISLTVSIGFAAVETNSETDYATLTQAAAANLAEAKATGRNRWVVRNLKVP